MQLYYYIQAQDHNILSYYIRDYIVKTEKWKTVKIR